MYFNETHRSYSFPSPRDTKEAPEFRGQGHWDNFCGRVIPIEFSVKDHLQSVPEKIVRSLMHRYFATTCSRITWFSGHQNAQKR